MPDTWDGFIDTAILGPCMDVFGYTITYSFQTGGSQVITGVFDREFLSLAALGAGPFPSQGALAIGAPGAISTRKPVLGVQLSQFTAGTPAQGDRLSVYTNAGEYLTFVVREVQPDGHGDAKLTLKLDV
jgi:hypothetical protein